MDNRTCTIYAEVAMCHAGLSEEEVEKVSSIMWGLFDRYTEEEIVDVRNTLERC